MLRYGMILRVIGIKLLRLIRRTSELTTPHMRHEMLKHHIRRDLEQHVRDEENPQRDIWLHPSKINSVGISIVRAFDILALETAVSM